MQLALNFRKTGNINTCLAELKKISPVPFKWAETQESLERSQLTTPEYFNIDRQVTLTFEKDADRLKFEATPACKSVYQKYAQ